MIYVVAQQHPTLPEVSMFTTKSKADADQYRAIGWTVLEIAAPQPEPLSMSMFANRADYEEALRAQPQPICPACHGPGLLYECVWCSAKNYPPEPQPVKQAAIDITIDDDALKFLRDMIAPAYDDDDELQPIRLLLGDGHSGYGLYVASADYPEEGASLLVDVPAPIAQPVKQAPDDDGIDGKDCTPNHLCKGHFIHLPDGEACDRCGFDGVQS